MNKGSVVGIAVEI